MNVTANSEHRFFFFFFFLGGGGGGGGGVCIPFTLLKSEVNANREKLKLYNIRYCQATVFYCAKFYVSKSKPILVELNIKEL